MKKKLIRLISTLSILILASATWATTPKPAKCPSVASIQQTSFIAAGQSTNGKYLAIQISNYDTAEKWAFGVVNIDASSNDDAVAKATLALSTLVYSQGPTHTKDDKWGCLYHIGYGYESVAITPISSEAVNTSVILKDLPEPDQLLNNQ